MILEQALVRNPNGNWEIDMEVIRKLSAQFDDGGDSDDCLFAKFLMTAYDTGFDAGVQEAEEQHRRAALLMMFTEGHA